MKKLYEFLSIIIIILMIVSLANCKKDSTTQSKIQNIIGYAQKGPFINGSSVTVYDLQSDLSPTGKSFNSQISNIHYFNHNKFLPACICFILKKS
jgi:uncharacterized lipoprotein YajG